MARWPRSIVGTGIALIGLCGLGGAGAATARAQGRAAAERPALGKENADGREAAQREAKRRAFASARALLLKNHVAFEPNLLLEDDWRSRLAQALDAVPEMKIDRTAPRRLRGVYFANRLMLPERTVARGDVVVIARQIVFLGPHPRIDAPGRNVSLFAVEATKHRLSPEQRVAFEAAAVSDRAKRRYTVTVNSGSDPGVPAADDGLPESALAESVDIIEDGINGYTGTEGGLGGQGQPGPSGTPGTNGTCDGSPHGGDGQEPADFGGMGGDAGDGGPGTPGGPAGNISIDLGPGQSGHYRLMARGGSGGAGGRGGEGGPGGAGGPGGRGGNGASCAGCSGNGGQGGPGAMGGIGGDAGDGHNGSNGGKGGDIYARWACQNVVVEADGNGGPGGAGGPGGSGGAPGNPGAGGAGGLSGGMSCNGGSTSNGAAGPSGPTSVWGQNGRSGANGTPGANGTVTLVPPGYSGQRDMAAINDACDGGGGDDDDDDDDDDDGCYWDTCHETICPECYDEWTCDGIICVCIDGVEYCSENCWLAHICPDCYDQPYPCLICPGSPITAPDKPERPEPSAQSRSPLFGGSGAASPAASCTKAPSPTSFAFSRPGPAMVRTGASCR